MSQYLPEEEEAKIYLPKYVGLYVILALSMFILVVRVWYLQIIEGEDLAEYSMRNRVKETKLPAPRGLILDRDERVLVNNLPGFDVTLTPQYTDNLDLTAKYVGSIVNIPQKTIVQKVKESKRKNGPFRPFKVKDHLSRDEVFRLLYNRYDHPGLEIGETIVRSYPFRENGAQLFGYVQEISKEQLARFNKSRTIAEQLKQGDMFGQTGLERTLDLVIRGADGANYMQVDARGREAKSHTLRLLEAMERTQEATPGQSVVLTIDADIQRAAYTAVNEQKDATGPRIGALVALKPDGEVLAWVSAPSYDPNDFATRITNDEFRDLINDPLQPLRNKVVQDHIPPGSTFKAIVALAGLQEKVITPSTTFHCAGVLNFGRPYHCHLKGGHGNVNVYEALERSCNIFFYRVGMALGIDRIAKYAKALGIGQRTGIDIVDEVEGLMPDSEWKLRKFGEPWQLGENLSNAIGQGFVLTTPIQLATAYSAIGQEGLLHKPFLVKQIKDALGKTVIKSYGSTLVRDLSAPSPNGVLIDKENFRIVKEGLRRVANSERGTAHWWKVPGIEIAGKTGTGQLHGLAASEIYSKCETRPLNQRHHGWFVGFAPAQKPLIIVAMLAQHACHGNTGAAPVVRDVIKAYFQKYHPDMLDLKKIQPITVPAGPVEDE